MIDPDYNRLEAIPGRWAGDAPPKHTYQWYRGEPRTIPHPDGLIYHHDYWRNRAQRLRRSIREWFCSLFGGEYWEPRDPAYTDDLTLVGKPVMITIMEQVAIPGATKPTYTPTEDDFDKDVSPRVT